MAQVPNDDQKNAESKQDSFSLEDLANDSKAQNKKHEKQAQQAREKYAFLPLSQDHIQNVKQLHDKVLPAAYDDSFYQCLLNKQIFSLLLFEKKYVKNKNKNKNKGKDKNKKILQYGDLVGVSTFRVQRRLESKKTVKVGRISTLGVKSNHRRRGLGKILVMQTIKQLNDKGCNMIDLTVLSDNKNAIKLYQLFGFQITETLKEHYTIKNKKYDGLLMVKYCNIDKNGNTKDDEIQSKSSSVHISNNRDGDDDIAAPSISRTASVSINENNSKVNAQELTPPLKPITPPVSKDDPQNG